MDGKRRTLIPAALTLLLLAVIPSAAWLEEQAAPPAAPGKGAAAPAAPEPSSQPGKAGELVMPMETKPAAGPAAATPKETGATTYTIKQADTLWDISNAFLKDPFLWPLIWKLNPYITNPDLIYPGNTLQIPGLAPIEQAIQAPPEAPPKEEVARVVPKKEEEAPVTREAAPELPFGGKRPVEAERPVEEEVPAGSRLILPEEATPPLIDKYAMLSAGFVAKDDGSRDTVVGGLEPKSMYSYDDVIFVRMRSKEEVNVGDRLLIYEPYKKVRHPETGKDFGKLTKVLGILQVTAREPSGVLSGRVTLSFDAIEKGNLVTQYAEPTLLYPSNEAKSKNIAGYILEVCDGRTINAQVDVVYLDKGALDGVEPGDRFTVYLEPRVKGYPVKVIGEVQVFLVKERTSTAVVKKSTDAMAKGDRVTSRQ